MPSRMIVALSLAIAALFALSACSQAAPSTPPKAGAPESATAAAPTKPAAAQPAPAQTGKVTIAYQPVASGLWTGFIMKAKKTYAEFIPSGVEVVFEAQNSGPPINNAMIAGKIDVGYLGDMPLVTNVEKATSVSGYDSRIVAISGKSFNFNRIFTSPDSPISSAKDLKGKTVATVRGSTADRFLIHVLAKEGIALGDVKIVNQDPSQSVASLQAKRVDAICVWEPMGSLVEYQKVGKEVANGQAYQPFFYIGGVAVTGQFIKEHPDWLVGVMKAHIVAQDFLTKNPKEAAEIIAKEVDMPVEVTRKAIEVNKYEPGLGPTEIAELQADVDYLAKQDMMTKIDVSKWVDVSYVDKALAELKKR